jgi:hypothetical protein
MGEAGWQLNSNWSQTSPAGQSPLHQQAGFGAGVQDEAVQV